MTDLQRLEKIMYDLQSFLAHNPYTNKTTDNKGLIGLIAHMLHEENVRANQTNNGQDTTLGGL